MFSLSGVTIFAWVKFAIIAALTATLLWYVYDYNTLGKKNVQLTADNDRLTHNLTQLTAAHDNRKTALDSLDKTCKDQLKLFLSEQEIWSKIDKSADPATDAANWAIEQGKEPAPKTAPKAKGKK